MVPHWNRLCWANHPTVTQWQPLHPDIEWLLHQVGRGSCSTIEVVAKSLFKVCLIGTCKLAIICSKLLLCTLLVQVWLYFCSYTLLLSADLHAYGIATSVDNRSRDGIPQPTQWRVHEESRDQTSSDHYIPPTGNIATQNLMFKRHQLHRREETSSKKTVATVEDYNFSNGTRNLVLSHG